MKTRRVLVSPMVSVAVAFVALITCLEPACCFDKTKWLDAKREGQHLEVTGSMRMAEKFYRQALELSREFPPKCSERIETLYHVANILVLQGKYWDAEVFYQRLISMVEEQKNNGTLDHEALVWMEDLADTYSTNVKGWLEYLALEHAVQLRDIISGDENKYMASTLRKLCTILLHENKCKEAEPYANRLVRITTKFKGPKELIKASDIFLLSIIEFNLGRYPKSESHIREAMRLYSKLEIPPGFCQANCNTQLAKVLMCQKQYDLAQQAATRALKIFERTNGKNFIGCVTAHEVLAQIGKEQKKYTDAVREYEQAISILEANGGANDPRAIPDLTELKTLYLKTNNGAKSRAVAKKIAGLSKPHPPQKVSQGH